MKTNATVYFPSGGTKIFDLKIGSFVFGFIDEKRKLFAPIFLPNDPQAEVTVLDPRVCICDEIGLVIYNPRDHEGKFESYMRDWMKENPNWPPQAGISSAPTGKANR